MRRLCSRKWGACKITSTSTTGRDEVATQDLHARAVLCLTTPLRTRLENTGTRAVGTGWVLEAEPVTPLPGLGREVSTTDQTISHHITLTVAPFPCLPSRRLTLCMLRAQHILNSDQCFGDASCLTELPHLENPTRNTVFK